MNTDRVRHYKRAINDARSRGVLDEDIAECINALGSDTNPGELFDALLEYTPGAEVRRLAGQRKTGPDSPVLQHAA